MAEVATINGHVKPSVEDVARWLEAKAERGEIAANTARLKVTALRQLTTPLGEDEPRDAAWVLEHIDDLSKRWATLNQQYQSATAASYASRARSAIEDYFRWRDNPTTFKFRDSGRKTSERADPSDVRKPEGPRKKNVAPPSDVDRPERSSGSARALPLGNGREFTFTIPDDLAVTDVRRIAAHLLTYATDWEPPTPAEAFAVVRS